MFNDINKLKAFERIAARGSMTDAARELGLSLAVISKRLASLEQNVGTRLVNRTTRSLHLTEEGSNLLPHIRMALQSLTEAEERLMAKQNEPFGLLRVTTPVSFGQRFIVPLLAKLIQLYPKMSVSLILNDELSNVTGGEIDVAVRIGITKSNQDAIVKRIATNTRILVASPDYLLRNGVPENPSELLSHELLRCGDALTGWRLYHVEGKSITIPAVARLRASSGEAVRSWCLAGNGIMLKSTIDVEADIRSKKLVRVLTDWDGGDVPVVALLPTRMDLLPMKTHIFTRMLIEHFDELQCKHAFGSTHTG